MKNSKTTEVGFPSEKYVDIVPEKQLSRRFKMFRYCLSMVGIFFLKVIVLLLRLVCILQSMVGYIAATLCYMAVAVMLFWQLIRYVMGMGFLSWLDVLYVAGVGTAFLVVPMICAFLLEIMNDAVRNLKEEAWLASL